MTHQSQLAPERNKFHAGNGADGKHYWLTPPELLARLSAEYGPFDFDPCPYPLPEGFDGLTCEWGQRNYVNPPFGSIIHDGKKTQTRRVMDPQPPEDVSRLQVGLYHPTVVRRGVEEPGDEVYGAWEWHTGEWAAKCRYGQPGDRLWVRETLVRSGGMVQYVADGRTSRHLWPATWKQDPRPSIHMDRWASRITLELTGVRAERIQDITPTDAWAEGVRPYGVKEGAGDGLNDHPDPEGATMEAFGVLWETINGPRGFGWDQNPWVWVLSFRRLLGEQHAPDESSR